MAIKFSQFNLRTDHTSGMYLVGYDGNQNIHITVDNLFDDFINGTENTIAMFGTGGTVLADSILSQDAGATLLTIAGQLNVDADATFDTSITVTGDSTLNGNVTLGDASTDLITQTGTLYLNGPVKDTTDTLGAVDQVLLSDASGELTFTDLADLNLGGAEAVEVPVKNVQGSALVKGDPVYISGSVGASGKLEVQLADASNALKMPAVGLLKQDLANNAEGLAVVTGKLKNLITDPIDGVNPTENDVIYVKPSGISGAALTTTKPVYGNFIQNIGKVGRVSTAADGNFVVSSILRTNDIPNLTPGRLWIGSTGNTIESQTLFVDEASGEVGIGTTNPYAELHIKNTVDNPGLMIESEQATGGNFQNSYINLRAAQTSNNTLANATITLHGVNSLNNAGAKTLVIRNQTLGGADVLISTLDSSSSAKNPARFKSSGQVQFEEYGSGSFTGTVAKSLAVDSSGNIIETDTPSGSGTLNYVPKWTPDGNTLGDSIIYDNGTQVGIGTTSPAGSSKLHVEGHTTVNNGNLNITNIIPAVYLNSSNSNPDWSLNNQSGEFSIRDNTLSQKRLTISSAGQAGLTLYGQGTFTGTPAYNISVDASGNLIETPNPSGGGGGGTVTSVGLAMPSAFTVTNSPVTSSGTLTVAGAGTAAQYIDGTGSLQTFPTSTIPTQVVTFMEWTGATNPYFNFLNGVDTTIPFDTIVQNSSTSPTQTPTVVTTASPTQTTFEVTDSGNYRISVNIHFFDLFGDIDIFCGVFVAGGGPLSNGGLIDKKDVTGNTDQNFFGSTVMPLAPGTVFELRANFAGGSGQHPFPSSSGNLYTSVLIERVDGATTSGSGGGGGSVQSLNDLTDASTISGGNANAENLILGPIASNLPQLCTTGCFGGNVVLQPEAIATNLRNGTRNIIIGRNSHNLSNASFNVVIGDTALVNNVDGSNTIAIGNHALRYNTKQFGTGNTAIGYYAGVASTTGGNNTCIGWASGWNSFSANATGSNVTTIGYNAHCSSLTVSDEITLGNSSVTALRCAVTSITSLSDERDKKDITDLEYGLDFIESLQPKQFVWDHRPETTIDIDEDGNEVEKEIENANKGKKDFGFIAQDVQPLDNDVLRLVYDENPDKLEMSYGKLVPILVKAVKELSDKVKALENA